MSTCYDAAGVKRLFADNGEHECLASVVAVYLAAGLKLHAELILNKACRLSLRYRELHRLTLCACGIEKAHVFAAIVFNGNTLSRINKIIAVFLLIEQIISNFFHFQYFLI